MQPRTYAKLAWGSLAYTVAVILWGAYVRATGSGAGCGDHWPLCNGEILPRVGTEKTLVELTHRVTSGLAWALAVVLAVYARKVAPRGAPVRRAAYGALFFMTTEALIGASIVLLEMVADNPALARGGWMAAHLVNTFLLLSALVLTAWYASGGERVRLRGQGLAAAAVLGSLAVLLLVGTSGAITALGDTLFPGTTFAEGLAPTAHLFLQLRVFHPVLALGGGLVVMFSAGYLAASRPSRRVRGCAFGVMGIFVLQLGLGYLNVYLQAPVWMQIVHLLAADLLWIGLMLLGAAALSQPQTALAAEPATPCDGRLPEVAGPPRPT